MNQFEKAGVFYLGKKLDSQQKLTDNLLLYDSKNFTTHAVCLGMTGSGKTGLGITIVEEAALDNIPVILIDPKGDLSNLLLTFPHLTAEEFKPWINPTEAEQKDLDVNAYAEKVADTWKKGLEEWGETKERIQKLRQNVEMVIYTPASQAGVPLSILSSFNAPKESGQSEFVRDEIQTIVSSLLGLLGMNADPIKSREHIYLSNIFQYFWNKGEDLSLPLLIQQIQKPPFDKVGALDINTFYSAKDRKTLAINLNNLLASPGFQNWMEGDPLEIDHLLTTRTGKSKISIISIAHLADSERMFFVTLLLNKLQEWMQKQPGTSSLRALFYMDEIFGYFPPTANPPSKLPMLKLLKQARAFGLGIILCTQNPADLDYKGLANCGTWFIGKLQTERDKLRVIEGLNTASNGDLNGAKLDHLLANMKSRVFIMRSIYEKEPLLFETRWTLSYLRGPLTLTQIQELMKDKKEFLPKKTGLIESQNVNPAIAARPPLPSTIEEYFVALAGKQNPHYKPFLGSFGKLHYVDSKNKIDEWKNVCLLSPINSAQIDWNKSENLPEILPKLVKEPLENSHYENIPPFLMNPKEYANLEKILKTHLYQNETLNLLSNPELNIISKIDEPENAFRSRVALQLREKRDEEIVKLKAKYQPKIDSFTDKIKRVQEKIQQYQEQSSQKKTSTFISIITTIMGAFFGKKITKGTINQAGTSIRKIGRVTKDSQTLQQMDDDLKDLKAKLDQTQQEMNQEISKSSLNVAPQSIQIVPEKIQPRKADILIEKMAIIWWPF